MISELDLAWLAGLVEGEGCLTGEKYKNPARRYRLFITNTDQSLLEAVQKTFRGSVQGPYINKRRPRKPYFQWQLNGHPACFLIKKLLPYMRGEKKESFAKFLGLNPSNVKLLQV